MKQLSAALTIAVSVLLARSAEAACTGRPTDAGHPFAYGAAAVQSHAGARARVHWATSGTHAPALASTRADSVPDTVAFALDVAEEALSRFEEMGYRNVPSDAGCASNGGDEKVDIYLVRFAGADGSTIAECQGASCSSYALVESTFAAKGYASAEEGFRTVVTHELFHAVQNTYRQNDAPFWAEGTAQWAMKTLHPDLRDFERNLPKFFEGSARSIDAPAGGVTAGFLYGSAVWPLFLAQNHGPETVRAIFELEAEGQDVLVATDAVLQARGSSLADAYPLFAAWNAGTAKLAGTGGYPEAASYPGIAIDALADGVVGITSGLSYHAYRGVLAAPSQVALETDATRNGGVVVPLEDGKARLDQAKKLPANAEGEVLVVVSGATTKKSDAPFTIRFLPPAAATAPASDGGCRVGTAGASVDAGVIALLLLGLGLVRRRR